MKKLFSMMLAVIMLVSVCLTGMSVSAAEVDDNTKVKIGVLVSDATSAEALAFRSYYEDYIQNVYNVSFMYSDELADASAEASAIDNFIGNNCQAIISLSSFDRIAQIYQCEDAGVYYAVATGTLSDEEYEEVKDLEYYVGAIGPDLATEYQTGYDMAKYFLDEGKTKFAVFGGAIPYYTDMHIFRAAGMLAAMCDAGKGDYKGATGFDIVGQIYADGGLETGNIGSVELIGYVGGYDMDDAWFGKCAEMSNAEGLEVLLAVGNGSDFFAASKASDVQIGSVDAYAESYGDAMKAGNLNYLAGKFSASIGPVFIAVLSAVQGHPVRSEDGSAIALSQGYWVATSSEQFDEYYAADSSKEDPAYTRELLDTIFGASYDDFTTFVSAYSFDEIKGMKEEK